MNNPHGVEEGEGGEELPEDGDGVGLRPDSGVEGVVEEVASLGPE